MSEPIAVVLAAGKGTRMQSDLPKVLCEVLGRAMIHYVLDALEESGFEKKVVVVGYEAKKVRQELKDRRNIEFVLQEEQLGTGHAVMVCRDRIAGHEGPLLVVAGDSPMIQVSSLKTLREYFEENQPACLLGTLNKEDPHGLGRIVRDPEGNFTGIVEEKDATDEQRAITEVNMSTYIFDNQAMLQVLSELKNQNSQGEYYITDCPALLLAVGKRVSALPVLKPCESMSINTVAELAIVEAEMRKLQS
ncbi:MAG: NTP transferase domain-containing protein [Planctomycetota bacterium]|nr:NTP transferase domain-containing protein [Planctomycetota bacterium]